MAVAHLPDARPEGEVPDLLLRSHFPQLLRSLSLFATAHPV